MRNIHSAMLVPWIRTKFAFWVLLALVVGCDTSGSSESKESAQPEPAAKQQPEPTPDKSEPPKGDDPVADMEKMVEAVCACKDVECVVEVQKRTAELGAKYKDGTMDAAQAQKLGDLARKFTKCATEIGGTKDAGGDGEK
jgi:hypothetical protein